MHTIKNGDSSLQKLKIAPVTMRDYVKSMSLKTQSSQKNRCSIIAVLDLVKKIRKEMRGQDQRATYTEPNLQEGNNQKRTWLQMMPILRSLPVVI